MEKFLDRMPQLRQGLISGVFQTKASSPWAGNKSQSIQVSLCLPSGRDLDTWYEAVFALPIARPDITDIDPHYLKKTSAHQLLFIRMQMGVSHMWGGISPQWSLLKYHLWNLGPGYYAGRLEELLILNRPCRPGEDVKDSVPCCPNRIGKRGRNGKVPRKRSKIRLPRQGLSGLLMRMKWFHTFWRSSVEMRLRWPSHTKKPKNTTLSKKVELRKDEGKMAHFQRHKVQALEGVRVESSKSTAELLAGREVLRAGSTSWRASFTVSLLGGLPVLVLAFVCVFVVGAVLLFWFITGIPTCFCSFAFDAQGRHLSKNVTIVMMSAAPEQKKKGLR